MKKVSTKNIKQIVTFKASAHELYEMLMDSKKHAKFTGETAKLNKRVGGKFTAYGTYITGKNLKLIPDRLIVQEWHMKGWPEGHVSKVMYLFTKTKTGTKLTFGHTNVPVESYKGINSGWKSSYWDKMKVLLGEKKPSKKVVKR